jgi:hypothetical protein
LSRGILLRNGDRLSQAFGVAHVLHNDALILASSFQCPHEYHLKTFWGFSLMASGDSLPQDFRVHYDKDFLGKEGDCMELPAMSQVRQLTPITSFDTRFYIF